MGCDNILNRLTLFGQNLKPSQKGPNAVFFTENERKIVENESGSIFLTEYGQILCQRTLHRTMTISRHPSNFQNISSQLALHNTVGLVPWLRDRRHMPLAWNGHSLNLQ
jgi:hypothetical protein